MNIVARPRAAIINACHFLMMGKQKAVLEMLAQILHIRHLLLQQGLAECLGTLVLVVSIRGRAGLVVFRIDQYRLSRHLSKATYK